MHTKQNAPHKHSKLYPHTPHPHPSPSSPHHLYPTNTTLEIIQAYFIQITHPWGSNQKTKIHMSIKIQFQVGSVLLKIAKFSKNYPLQPPFQHPQLHI